MGAVDAVATAGMQHGGGALIHIFLVVAFALAASMVVVAPACLFGLLQKRREENRLNRLDPGNRTGRDDNPRLPPPLKDEEHTVIVVNAKPPALGFNSGSRAYRQALGAVEESELEGMVSSPAATKTIDSTASYRQGNITAASTSSSAPPPQSAQQQQQQLTSSSSSPPAAAVAQQQQLPSSSSSSTINSTGRYMQGNITATPTSSIPPPSLAAQQEQQQQQHLTRSPPAAVTSGTAVVESVSLQTSSKLPQLPKHSSGTPRQAQVASGKPTSPTQDLTSVAGGQCMVAVGVDKGAGEFEDSRFSPPIPNRGSCASSATSRPQLHRLSTGSKRTSSKRASKRSSKPVGFSVLGLRHNSTLSSRMIVCPTSVSSIQAQQTINEHVDGDDAQVVRDALGATEEDVELHELHILTYGHCYKGVYLNKAISVRSIKLPCEDAFYDSLESIQAAAPEPSHARMASYTAGLVSQMHSNLARIHCATPHYICTPVLVEAPASQLSIRGGNGSFSSSRRRTSLSHRSSNNKHRLTRESFLLLRQQRSKSAAGALPTNSKSLVPHPSPPNLLHQSVSVDRPPSSPIPHHHHNHSSSLADLASLGSSKLQKMLEDVAGPPIPVTASRLQRSYSRSDSSQLLVSSCQPTSEQMFSNRTQQQEQSQSLLEDLMRLHVRSNSNPRMIDEMHRSTLFPGPEVRCSSTEQLQFNVNGAKLTADLSGLLPNRPSTNRESSQGQLYEVGTKSTQSSQSILHKLFSGITKFIFNESSQSEVSVPDSPSLLAAELDNGGLSPHQLNQVQWKRECQFLVVQEECDFCNLSRALHNYRFYDPKLSLPRMEMVAEIAKEISSGLLHLHACGLVVGNLSSENVLLHRESASLSGFTAKLSDYGLNSPVLQGVIPTHHGAKIYQAPEVIESGYSTQAGDVYSFGVILWELYYSTMAWVNQDDPIEHPEFPDFQLDCPHEYALLTSSCLHPDPGSRPSIKRVAYHIHSLKREIMRNLTELYHEVGLLSGSASGSFIASDFPSSPDISPRSTAMRLSSNLYTQLDSERSGYINSPTTSDGDVNGHDTGTSMGTLRPSKNSEKSFQETEQDTYMPQISRQIRKSRQSINSRSSVHSPSSSINISATCGSEFDDAPLGSGGAYALPRPLPPSGSYGEIRSPEVRLGRTLGRNTSTPVRLRKGWLQSPSTSQAPMDMGDVSLPLPPDLVLQRALALGLLEDDNNDGQPSQEGSPPCSPRSSRQSSSSPTSKRPGVELQTSRFRELPPSQLTTASPRMNALMSNLSLRVRDRESHEGEKNSHGSDMRVKAVKAWHTQKLMPYSGPDSNTSASQGADARDSDNANDRSSGGSTTDASIVSVSSAQLTYPGTAAVYGLRSLGDSAPRRTTIGGSAGTRFLSSMLSNRSAASARRGSAGQLGGGFKPYHLSDVDEVAMQAAMQWNSLPRSMAGDGVRRSFQAVPELSEESESLLLSDEAGPSIRESQNNFAETLDAASVAETFGDELYTDDATGTASQAAAQEDEETSDTEGELSSGAAFQAAVLEEQ